MTNEVKSKTRPAWAVISQGTALGTATGIIDTSGWQYMLLMNKHGGTGGSRTVSVYANAGTTYGTAATTFPDAVFIGSGNSDQAGAGSLVWTCGSLTDQTIIAYGTSSNSSWSLSYILFD